MEKSTYFVYLPTGYPAKLASLGLIEGVTVDDIVVRMMEAGLAHPARPHAAGDDPGRDMTVLPLALKLPRELVLALQERAMTCGTGGANLIRRWLREGLAETAQ